MMVYSRLEFVELDELREHEETDPERLQNTLRAIEAVSFLAKPLAADHRTLVVLDGAHRLNALRRKQCRVVPVRLVDYMSEEIVVYSMDRKTIISKDDVIEAALSGRKFPPRTTWHMIRMENGCLEHISLIEGEINFPLSALTNHESTMNGQGEQERWRTH
jgi:hypothetical protein